jgi:hypothetical protein
VAVTAVRAETNTIVPPRLEAWVRKIDSFGNVYARQDPVPDQD